jgi:uncharacterized protein YqjF (DUF2071 family)
MLTDEGQRHPPVPVERVERDVMRMWWEDLTFLHWPYEPSEVQSLLPAGLTAEPWDDGMVYVGLVPFLMRVGFPGGRPMPKWAGVFCETNVRTYVIGPDGTPGVYFFSLEAGRLPATATARLTYGLPYFWADMSMANAGSIWTYRSSRRWPGPKGAVHASSVRAGASIALDDVSPFEHYLTSRWGLYSTLRNRLLYAPVDHGRWPLQQAEVLELDDELMQAAGLTSPIGPPIAHWTSGTEVRVGRPRFAR